MSSISFPSSREDSQDTAEGPYYAQGFDASASFQINPLSSHPPRAPHHSNVAHEQQHSSGAGGYGTSLYGKAPAVTEDEDGSFGEQEDRMELAESRIRREDVWREIFVTSNGRDKAFKLIQYSIRLFLVFHAVTTGNRFVRRSTTPAREVELLRRLDKAASGFSFSRKLLLFFNWLAPLTAITSQQTVPYSTEQPVEPQKKTRRPFLHTVLYAPPPVLLELVSGLSDDIATCGLLGLLGPRVSKRAARFSDWCWLLSTMVGLVENGVERQIITGLQSEVENRMYKESMSGAMKKSKSKLSRHDELELGRLRRQDQWLRVSQMKLVMDLIFVSYELFNIKRARNSVKAVTGLAAAVLSTAKLYDRHRNVLLKSWQSSS